MKPGRLTLAAHGQQDPCATYCRHPPSASCPRCSHKVWEDCGSCLHFQPAELKEGQQCFSDQVKIGGSGCPAWASPGVKPAAHRCSGDTEHTAHGDSLRPADAGCTWVCCPAAEGRRFCRTWLILPGMWVLGGTITAVDSFILFAKSRKWKCCRRDSIISPISLFNSGTKCTFIPVQFAATNWGFLPLTPGCFHLFCQPIPCQSKDIHY